ncbi:MAG: DUF2163 domain-containing protein [Rhizomicrobium sp.]
MSLLRSCPAALAAALASHSHFYLANLFTVTLSDGTVYRWTDWEQNLTASGHTYTAMKLKRGKWSLTNSMTVPCMDFSLYATNAAFDGGASIKTQVLNGLFDDALILHSRAYMTSPGDTSAFGVLDLNSWIPGEIAINGTTVDMTLKGKNNRLNQQAPRNVYQAGCVHSFCDAVCTLARASYTTSHSVGTAAAVSRTFIPWDSAPSDYALYKSGTVKITGGDTAGQSRTILAASASGLTLVYPLYAAPAAGDAFTAFKGCQKTLAACQAYGNSQHWRAWPYTPDVEKGF